MTLLIYCNDGTFGVYEVEKLSLCDPDHYARYVGVACDYWVVHHNGQTLHRSYERTYYDPPNSMRYIRIPRWLYFERMRRAIN